MPERVVDMSNRTIICRCEDLTVKEIREWINKGYGTLEEIKELLDWYGTCQGRTCRRHLVNELARAAGKEPGKSIFPPSPPTKPLKFESIIEADDDA